MEENQQGLTTILFSVFRKDLIQFLPLATLQAKKFPTWCGAEGCINVVENTKRAINIGMKGTICAPAGNDQESPKWENWMFDNLRIANSIQKRKLLL
jgi:hypothetical protein